MIQNLHLIQSINKIKEFYDSEKTFCAIDTETTGLNCSKERVIEIGAVKFNNKGIIDTFSTLLNPQIDIPLYCTELTGITNELLKDAPYANEIIPKFRQFCNDSILIAHNAQFDLRFINAESERLKLTPLTNQAVDTLRLSRILLPLNQSWKQTNLANQFSIEVKSAHRAFDDARVCMELFKILISLPIPKKQKKKQPIPITHEEP